MVAARGSNGGSDAGRDRAMVAARGSNGGSDGGRDRQRRQQHNLSCEAMHILWSDLE